MNATQVNPIGTWPPPDEYYDAKRQLAQARDDTPGLPDSHRQAIQRARHEYPGRAAELRRLFRILDVGRRMDSLYRRERTR